MNKPPHEIFKAYDIRGIVGKTLTNNIIKTIGHSIGSEAQARGLTSIAIGRDGRLSGSELSHSLAEGIQESGINVLIQLLMFHHLVQFLGRYSLVGYDYL